MSFRSTSDRYGAIPVTIHWLTALLIVGVLVTGFRAGHALDSPAKLVLLKAHVPMAVCVLLLTLTRIAWWVFIDRKPAPAAGPPLWQERLARAVHLLFYVATLGLAASGVGILILSGAGPTIFGQGGVLPDFWNYPPRIPHGIGARMLIALFVIHVFAALFHHFYLRDGLLRRMWYA